MPRLLRLTNWGFVDPENPPPGATLFAPDSPEAAHVRDSFESMEKLAAMPDAEIAALHAQDPAASRAPAYYREEAAAWCARTKPTPAHTVAARWPEPCGACAICEAPVREGLLYCAGLSPCWRKGVGLDP